MKPPAPPFTTGQAEKSSVRPRTLSRGGWAWFPRELILEAAPTLGPLAVAVYVALSSFANGDSVAFPSLGTLARTLGCSRHAVRRAVDRLERHGLILKERLPGPGRVRVRYILTDPTSWRLPRNPDWKAAAQFLTQSATPKEVVSQAENVAPPIASLTQSLTQSPSIVSDREDRPSESGQPKELYELTQLCQADPNGKIDHENSDRKPGSPELEREAQLCQLENPQGNGDRETTSVGNRHVTKHTNDTNEQEKGVAALLRRGSASLSRGDEEAGLIANLVEELRELDVRDPEDLIKTALRHGWTLGDLAEVVSCAAEYSIDGSLEELVGCSAPEWLADVIPRGPKAAWDVLRRLLERDLADPPAFPELAWMAGEPLGWRWWRWRLQRWLEVRREEAAGDPRVERFLARPVYPPWRRERRSVG